MRKVNISKSSRGWDMHVDGQYLGSYATQQEALSQIEFRVPEHNPQVTIDCRGEADRVIGFVSLIGEAELFKTQHELGHQTPQQIFQDLMTD